MKLCRLCGRPRKGRWAADEDDIESFEIGASVKLSESFSVLSDAAKGPLAPGQNGEVLQVGPHIPGYGRRIQVCCAASAEHSRLTHLIHAETDGRT